MKSSSRTEMKLLLETPESQWPFRMKQLPTMILLKKHRKKKMCCAPFAERTLHMSLQNTAHIEESRYVCISCRDKIVITHGTVPKKMFQGASDKSSSSKTSRSQLPQLEGFQFERKIGKGTMGNVYKARETATDRVVAIKTFTSHSDVNSEKMRLLQRELQIIQHLKHKHIVQFFGYKQQGNTLYFVFEFVEGMTLRKFMLSQKGPVPLIEALPILLGALNGLAVAHRTRITARTSGGRFHIWEGIVPPRSLTTAYLTCERWEYLASENYGF